MLIEDSKDGAMVTGRAPTTQERATFAKLYRKNALIYGLLAIALIALGTFGIVRHRAAVWFDYWQFALAAFWSFMAWRSYRRASG